MPQYAIAQLGSSLQDALERPARDQSPYIGYAKTAEIAKESVKTGRTIRELVLERGLMEPKQLDQVAGGREHDATRACAGEVKKWRVR